MVPGSSVSGTGSLVATIMAFVLFSWPTLFFAFSVIAVVLMAALSGMAVAG